jgi:MoaA/NifB/PqqE/SkfB family radical SAM enzyme
MPVMVEIDLTNVCSLGCQSCHFAHTHVAGPWAVMPTDKPSGYSDTGKFADVAMLKRALTEMASAGVQSVVYTGGGEPTLHPQFSEIVEHGGSVRLQQGIYTLGGHFTPRMLQASKALTWAVVSLDCVDAVTYSKEKRVPMARYEAACQGVRDLGRIVPTVGVSFLLHAENWREMGRMIGITRELGATYTTFRPTVETSPAHQGVCTADRSWITEALPDLERYAHEPDVEVDPSRFVAYRDWAGHGYPACYGIRLVTMVTPDGRVWVCPNRRGMPGSELGSLQTESFEAIWSRHPRQWTDFTECRVMCRLHSVNQVLASVHQPRQHEAFV